MTFAPEDKAAWNSSEIMSEFEKIALETDLLNGPPKEANMPIDLEEEDDEDVSWEDEDIEDANIENKIDVSEIALKLIEPLKALSSNLESANKIEYRKLNYVISQIEKAEKFTEMFNILRNFAEELKKDGKTFLADTIVNLIKSVFSELIENRGI